jgi:hypothetical protein
VDHWDVLQAIAWALIVPRQETMMITTMIVVRTAKYYQVFPHVLTRFPDMTDSNNPNSQQSSDGKCTTSTFSSCRTFCIAASTTTCASSTSTCSDVIGCDTTGTSYASTITPAPGAIIGPTDTWVTASDNFDYDESVAESIITFLGGIGDFGNVTSTGPTSIGSSSPTRTSGSSSSLPTLSTGTPYSGSGCATYTVSKVCNGSGEQSACQTETLCVPSTVTFSTILTQGTATCTSNGICVSTTVFTECEETTGGQAKRTIATAPITARATATAEPLAPAISFRRPSTRK